MKNTNVNMFINLLNLLINVFITYLIILFTNFRYLIMKLLINTKNNQNCLFPFYYILSKQKKFNKLLNTIIKDTEDKEAKYRYFMNLHTKLPLRIYLSI